MIPKTIHYCWFGRNPLPDTAIKCINSWKKFFPEYEIKEWNEDNFDVNILPYTHDAYQAKKFAFVSDFARFWILYHSGGVYFDTDVEVIKSFDDILQKGAFMGCEIESKGNRTAIVNPGLGIAVRKEHPIYAEMLKRYESLPFFGEDGSINNYTMIPIITEILANNGFKAQNGVQEVSGITIYPTDYFNPYDDLTGKLNITDNTRSIHWYMASWMKKQNSIAKHFKQLIRRVFNFSK